MGYRNCPYWQGVCIKWIAFRENVRAFFPHGNSKLSVIKWGDREAEFDQCSVKRDHSGLDPNRVHPPHHRGTVYIYGYSDFHVTLKNGLRKCLLFVLSANGWKIKNIASPCSRQSLNPNMEKTLFDWPIVLQYDVKAKYRLNSRKFSGMKFFHSSFRLTNQKPRAFVSVR